MDDTILMIRFLIPHQTLKVDILGHAQNQADIYNGENLIFEIEWLSLLKRIPLRSN